MAIEVPLGKSGNLCWITQHYGINGWELRPMVIPQLARCIGMFIFWKTTTTGSKIPVYSVTAAHIPPHLGKNSVKRVRREFFTKLFKEMRWSEPYLILIAGGKTDNAVNEVHKERSLRYFAQPFAYGSPKRKRCQVILHEHPKSVMFTDFVLDKSAEVHLRHRHLKSEN